MVRPYLTYCTEKLRMAINEKIASCIVDHDGTSFKSLYLAFKPWFESFKRGEPEHICHLQGMKDHNLSEFEALFILGYTGRCSSWVNWELRDGRPIVSECKRNFLII